VLENEIDRLKRLISLKRLQCIFSQTGTKLGWEQIDVI
jgi:hypothetical protein